MLKFRKEEGLTLVELLVVIALVGVVASISLPILINTVQNAQTTANSQSADEIEKFANDWYTAGFELQVTAGSGSVSYLEAVDTKSNVVAKITIDTDRVTYTEGLNGAPGTATPVVVAGP